MVKVPFEKRERPVQPVTTTPEIPGIDLPGVDGVSERALKKTLVRMIDWLIEKLLGIKARLRAPVKAADMPEIEEE